MRRTIAGEACGEGANVGKETFAGTVWRVAGLIGGLGLREPYPPPPEGCDTVGVVVTVAVTRALVGLQSVLTL